MCSNINELCLEKGLQFGPAIPSSDRTKFQFIDGFGKQFVNQIPFPVTLVHSKTKTSLEETKISENPDVHKNVRAKLKSLCEQAVPRTFPTLKISLIYESNCSRGVLEDGVSP
jgi:hypothetical protein